MEDIATKDSAEDRGQSQNLSIEFAQVRITEEDQHQHQQQQQQQQQHQQDHHYHQQQHEPQHGLHDHHATTTQKRLAAAVEKENAQNLRYGNILDMIQDMQQQPELEVDGGVLQEDGGDGAGGDDNV